MRRWRHKRHMFFKPAWRRVSAVVLLLLCVLLAIPPALLNDVSFSRAVYDRHGQLLRLTLSADGYYRLFVPLSDISPTLIDAVLLYEDQHFFVHPGVNPVSIARAAWHHMLGGGRGGASTLTMQLVRLKHRLNTRSYSGKVWQMLQALRLELHYSKSEILQAYLNLAPYGGNVEGVAAASRIYFERDAQSLSLPEALTLSVIPQSPLARTPGRSSATDQALLQARLRAFVPWQKKYSQDARYATLLQRPMRYGRIANLPFIAPQLTTRLLKQSQAQRIDATLDARLQQQLAGQIYRYVQYQRAQGIANAAALLVDTRDMAVLASVGSADYFNLYRQGMIDGTQARRSPGSALKPFIYALAFEQGIIHPASLLTDAPSAYGTYTPENFDHAFQGPLSAHDALIRSRNIPALWLSSQLTKPGFYHFLQQAGIKRMQAEKNYGLSLALGGVEVTMKELVQLYAMLSNGGVYAPLQYIRAVEVVDVVDDLHKPEQRQLLSPEAAFMALDILKDTPPPVGSIQTDALPLPIYWKTGTSAGLRDAWSVGVFGPYVLAVWVGDFRGSVRGNYVGIVQAAPLFFELIRGVVEQLSANKVPIMDKVQAQVAGLKLVKSQACADTGDINHPYCPVKVPMWLIPGVSPIKQTGIYRHVLVNRETGKLACRFVVNQTDYRVVQFWPSEITQVFAQAGIVKPPPLAWEPGCSAAALSISSTQPRIVSPARHVRYKIRMGADNRLPLKAVVDGNARSVFWLVDDVVVASAAPNDPVWLPLTLGTHRVRLIDDAGNADSSLLVVE